jgi:ribosomal protein L1
MSTRSKETMLVNRFAEERESIRIQLGKAVNAIKKYAAKKEELAQANSGTVELISTPAAFTVSFSLNTIPVKKDYRFNTVVLPNRIIDASNTSMCLLVRDPKEKAVEAVKKEELPFEKIIAVKSLKRKYASHEARQELANRFDLFFCETPIYEMMGKLLGRYFFEVKKAKIPMPLVNLTKSCFEKSLSTSRFRVRGGAVVGIKVGNMSMDSDMLAENALAAIEHMASKYCVSKKTENDVFNIALGATNIIDLPIWSVPVSTTTPSTPAVEEVEIKTPKGAKSITPAETTAPAAPVDLASVPVKDLKRVQAARAAEAKKQIGGTPEKKQRKTK